MSIHWSKEEDSILINTIHLYRTRIIKKDLKEAKQLTKEFALEIYQQNPSLQIRTINAISERLPYLDNLLAGVFEESHYAIKDRYLYSTSPREDNNRIPNLCNARHQYNGALEEFSKVKDH